MPYTMDPYVLLFVIPISILFVLSLMTYLIVQGTKLERETQTLEKKGARWQAPRIIRVRQSNPDGVRECVLLVIRNIGDTPATDVRVWATAEERELKVRRKKKLSFPPVNPREKGISLHPNNAAEFVISNIKPNQDFWIQWKEDGLPKSRLLGSVQETTLGIWTRDSTGE